MLMFPTLMRTMLSPRDTLKVECGVCQHRAVFTRAEAFALFSPAAMPSDVHARLRCSACGAVRRANAWI